MARFYDGGSKVRRRRGWLIVHGGNEKASIWHLEQDHSKAISLKKVALKDTAHTPKYSPANVVDWSKSIAHKPSSYIPKQTYLVPSHL